MSTQSNYKTVNHNQFGYLAVSVASMLLGLTLCGGGATNVNADATNTGNLSSVNYTLPAPNDEGDVVEQHITQNVTSNVNVTDANGHSQVQTQTAILTGSQLYDQTHGIVLEGHVGPTSWRTVNLPTSQSHQVSKTLPNTTLPTTNQDESLSAWEKASRFDQKQATNLVAPTTVVESQQAIQLTPNLHHSVKNETAAVPQSSHLAGASVGLLGIVTMMAGLFGWKKYSE